MIARHFGQGWLYKRHPYWGDFCWPNWRPNWPLNVENLGEETRLQQTWPNNLKWMDCYVLARMYWYVIPYLSLILEGESNWWFKLFLLGQCKAMVLKGEIKLWHGIILFFLCGIFQFQLGKSQRIPIKGSFTIWPSTSSECHQFEVSIRELFCPETPSGHRHEQSYSPQNYKDKIDAYHMMFINYSPLSLN